MYLNLYLMVLTVVENVLKYFKRERGGAGGGCDRDKRYNYQNLTTSTDKRS